MASIENIREQWRELVSVIEMCLRLVGIGDNSDTNIVQGHGGAIDWFVGLFQENGRKGDES